MRLVSSAVLLGIGVLTSVASPQRMVVSARTCDLRGIFDAASAPSGTMALTPIGEVAEIDMILVPGKLDMGSYAVTVSRKAQDLYHVDGTQVYLLTAYCNEYSLATGAVLRYAGGAGAGSGKLVFSN